MKRLTPLTKSVLCVFGGVYFVLTSLALAIWNRGDAAALIFLLPIVFVMISMLLAVLGGMLHDAFVSNDKERAETYRKL